MNKFVLENIALTVPSNCQYFQVMEGSPQSIGCPANVFNERKQSIRNKAQQFNSGRRYEKHTNLQSLQSPQLAEIRD